MNGFTAVASTRVVADGIVYVARGNGTVNAYYASGPNVGVAVPTWNKQTLLDEFGRMEIFSSSPVITKNYIFIAGRRMHKLDRKTGNELAAHLYSDNDAQFSSIA